MGLRTSAAVWDDQPEPRSPGLRLRSIHPRGGDVPVCEHCGRKNSPDARFCSNCGVALGARDEGSLEERKVVSVLFCDLVGFTALSHATDPEDVSRLLDRYHATVRAETE